MVSEITSQYYCDGKRTRKINQGAYYSIVNTPTSSPKDPVNQDLSIRGQNHFKLFTLLQRSTTCSLCQGGLRACDRLHNEAARLLPLPCKDLYPQGLHQSRHERRAHHREKRHADSPDRTAVTNVSQEALQPTAGKVAVRLSKTSHV